MQYITTNVVLLSQTFFYIRFVNISYEICTVRKYDILIMTKILQIYIQGPFTGKPEFFFREHLLQTLK